MFAKNMFYNIKACISFFIFSRNSVFCNPYITNILHIFACTTMLRREAILMNKLTELWQSPYPMLYQRWKAVVIPSVIIFLILYILQPFGFSRIKEGVFWVVAGSALIAAGASSIFTYLLPALFPTYYKEQNWTLGKHVLDVLLMLLLIAVGIWVYHSWLMGMWLDKRLFFLALSWVMVLAPFPVVFFLLWNRNLQLTRNLQEAMEINCHLSKRASQEVGAESKEFSPEEVLVFSGGTKDMLEVKAVDFLYAEAEGNYVKVDYRLKGESTRKMLRATMKQAEEAVAACPFIIRCHRAFLVNARKVVKVDGNSQGYRLRLEGGGEEIPVSRAYAKEVKALIENKIKR